ncbi:hypothetical protein Y032_0066g3784 [Ancylostoma ceylanicum]|uniref:Triosephosphate isomerase n=1 Tax=Ancylostoma ceylanicum TaxID=53326 RepID=A0A016U0U1_9BILA|nr:hypothetical protein Y032_0066g3784 [Ancylostoma ceylanicum]
MTRKFFVGGNWKMNGDKSSIDGICVFLNQSAGSTHGNFDVGDFAELQGFSSDRELIGNDEIGRTRVPPRNPEGCTHSIQSITPIGRGHATHVR